MYSMHITFYIINNLCENFWNNDSFTIKKSEWKYSLDIYINNYNDIDIKKAIDFYLIIRSYIYFKKYNVKSIYIISNMILNDIEFENKKFSFSVYKFVSLSLLNKFSVYDFYIWFDKMFINEYKYGDNNYKAQGFRIVFYDEIELLYPKYPWSNEWLEYNNII